jgi:hypothetical protein
MAETIFPFFDRDLRCAFAMVELVGEMPFVRWGQPFVIHRREVKYPLLMDREQSVASLRLDQLVGLWHFDPWWTFRRRHDVPLPLKQAVMATNLASRLIAGAAIADVAFDDWLMNVEGIWVRRGLGIRSWLSREDLLRERVLAQ